MALPKFRAAGTYLESGSGASAVLVAPAGRTAGDILIAEVYKESTTAPTAPAPSGGGATNWTLFDTEAQTASGETYYVYRYWLRYTDDAAAGISGGSATFTWTGAVWRDGVMHAWYDTVATGTPVELINKAAAGAGSSSSPAVSGTPAGANRTVLWLLGSYWGGTWTGAGLTGWTARIHDNVGALSLFSREYASPAATGSLTAALTGTDELTHAKTASLIALVGEPSITTGSLAASIPAPAAAVDGQVVATGALAAAIPAPAVALAGDVEEPVEKLIATIPAPTAALTGTVTTTGALAATIPPPAAAAAGTVTQTGQLAAAIPPPTMAAAARVPIPDMLRLNGLPIRRFAHRSRDMSTLLRVPEKRGGDIVIPGRHGERRIPGKLYGAGVAALPLAIVGVDPEDGRIPAGSTMRRQLHERIDELMEAIGEETVLIEYTRTNGEEREITGEVLDVIEPKTELQSGVAELDLVIRLADPFWRDIDDTTTDNVVEGPTGTTARLSGFDGATAPMEDLFVELGPVGAEACLNPRLEQQSSGIWVAWAGTISAGQTLRIWTHDDQWVIDGTGGLVVAAADYERLSYGGLVTRRWFAMRPEPGGPELTLTHTGGGSSRATVVGRRKHKTAA
ncbi:hypothetical protein ACL02T_32900 [Pseudonocardia sp. RS010]|uniref:hypothetical protein n=1 Tax=Pseudonocardia sp. RS010 TaxID=3385979 RepID=UPI0039A243AA